MLKSENLVMFVAIALIAIFFFMQYVPQSEASIVPPKGYSSFAYQETANEYYYTDDGNMGFIYINYTKYGPNVDGSLWQIRHGETTQNYTIPNTCLNTQPNVGNTKLRLYVTTQLYPIIQTHGYCWNSISWTEIWSVSYPNQNAGGMQGTSVKGAERFYDDNWSTDVDFNGVSGSWFGPAHWEYDFWKQYPEARLYEEAVWWRVG